MLSAYIMAAALALLFLGYESSRAASIALLAAKGTGLGSEALPFAVALGSPAGGLVLYLYARSIKTKGAKYTLRVSNVVCVCTFWLMLLFHDTIASSSSKAQYIVIAFYVFREIYVSLLSTQHWSFISSVLDSKRSSPIVSFTGIVSISSAIGSVAVEVLVNYGGVKLLLLASFLCTFLSFVCSEFANAISTGPQGGMNPHRQQPQHHHQRSSLDKSTGKASPGGMLATNGNHSVINSPSRSTAGKAGEREHNKKASVWSDSYQLLSKHTTLQFLFLEAVLHQGCSNMLNLTFHDGLRHNLTEDTERATLVGRFFTFVNLVACALQLFVLPKLLNRDSLPSFLIIIPVCVSACTAIAYFYENTVTVMFGFGSMKILEYSIMSSAMEMIYMPMGHEVRYLGTLLLASPCLALSIYHQ